MKHLTVTRGAYSLTTDRTRLDVTAVHAYLSRTGKYWARDISKDLVGKSMKHSLCFGLFHEDRQVGFARVVTDYSTYAYLCDVYVLEDHQGQGLGEWMIENVMAHPDLQRLRRFQLVTRDAHGLYKRFGFETVASAPHHMEIFKPGLYSRKTIQRTARRARRGSSRPLRSLR
jgi:ribosomal protein S18 acetylase RimI-like enzyme